MDRSISPTDSTSTPTLSTDLPFDTFFSPLPTDTWFAAPYEEDITSPLHFPITNYFNPPSSPFLPPPSAATSQPTPLRPVNYPPPAPFGSSPEERQNYYFQRYTPGRFRKHCPEWVNGDWLPRYKYSAADAIWDYWVEWKDGADGYISVEELNTVWGAKWRRNIAALKTESGRRMKVIKLITELSLKPRWNVNLVKRFITDKYAAHYRARAFADYLTKNQAVVVAAAANYP